MPVITFYGCKIDSIIFNSILFNGKVNFLGDQNLKLPMVFKSTGKNKIKIKENGNFHAKSDSWCNSKINYRRYMKFSLNVYICISLYMIKLNKIF